MSPRPRIQLASSTSHPMPGASGKHLSLFKPCSKMIMPVQVRSKCGWCFQAWFDTGHAYSRLILGDVANRYQAHWSARANLAGHLTNQTNSSDIAHAVAEIATVSASPGADAATATAPERIKIHLAGNLMSRDGRFYIFHVEAFTADGADIPVDLAHGITKNDEPNGLCGRVNWLGAVKDILSARSPRFTFPSSLSQKGRATCLHSVALVAGSRHSQCRRFSRHRNRASCRRSLKILQS